MAGNRGDVPSILAAVCGKRSGALCSLGLKVNLFFHAAFWKTKDQILRLEIILTAGLGRRRSESAKEIL